MTGVYRRSAGIEPSSRNKHRLTHLVWRPLVEVTRRRYLLFRSRLMASDEARGQLGGGAVVSAGL